MCNSLEVTATNMLFKAHKSSLVLFRDLILSFKKGCYQLNNSLWICEAQTVLQTMLNKYASLITTFVLKSHSEFHGLH